jgi:hypothetical protein
VASLLAVQCSNGEKEEKKKSGFTPLKGVKKKPPRRSARLSAPASQAGAPIALPAGFKSQPYVDSPSLNQYRNVLANKTGNRWRLWWTNVPTVRITYANDRETDFMRARMEFRNKYGSGASESAKTWHHTGVPLDDQTGGYIQLVPTNEHQALAHIGVSAVIDGYTDS